MGRITFGVIAGPEGIRVQSKARCRECGRVFDLTDDTDSMEWYEGHDCEERA